MPDGVGDNRTVVLLPSREILRGTGCSFQVLSRAAVGTPFAQEPCLVISIHDPDSGAASICETEQVVDVLRVSFHDTRYEGRGLERFTVRHAQQITEFVQRRREVPLVVVQCTQGVSRSAAVAAELSRWQNGEAHDEEWFVRHFAPNLWVRETLRAYIERRMTGDQ